MSKRDRRITRPHQPSRTTVTSKAPPVAGEAAEIPATDNTHHAERPGTRPATIGKVVSAVFIVSLLAGYLAGTAASPDYEHPTRAPEAISTYITRSSYVWFPQWSVKRSPNGRLNEFRLQGGVIRFHCGFTRFSHDLRTGAAIDEGEVEKREEAYVRPVFRELKRDAHPLMILDPATTILSLESHRADMTTLDPENHFWTPRRGTSLHEVVGVMLGGAELYSAKYAAREVSSYWKEMEGVSHSTRIARTLKLVAAGVSGFALGFYLGYSDNFDCDDKLVVGQLNQSALWQAVGSNLSQFYSWQFRRDSSQAIGGIDTVGGRRLTLREAWIGFHSVRRSLEFDSQPDDFIISEQLKADLTANTKSRDPSEYLPFWLSIAEWIADEYSSRYADSRLALELHRAVMEHLLWKKERENRWIPRDDSLVEGLIGGRHFAFTSTPLSTAEQNRSYRTFFSRARGK